MNTCMGTINGTSVDRFIVDDADILVLTCTKTWSEYMNMHLVNTCKQWRKYRLSYVMIVYKANQLHKANQLASRWQTCTETLTANLSRVPSVLSVQQIAEYNVIHCLCYMF